MPNIIINIPLYFTGIIISLIYIYWTRAQVVGNGFCSSVVQHWSSNTEEHRCSILLFHYSLTTCSIMHVPVYEQRCWFIMMVATLFESFRSSSHEPSVPTCMNKPVNNHVQAGQLNHVQACQQTKTSCGVFTWHSWVRFLIRRYLGSVMAP